MVGFEPTVSRLSVERFTTKLHPYGSLSRIRTEDFLINSQAF